MSIVHLYFVNFCFKTVQSQTPAGGETVQSCVLNHNLPNELQEDAQHHDHANTIGGTNNLPYIDVTVNLCTVLGNQK